MVGRPALERPVLIAAFRGWNDGGQGATLARVLARTWSAERFADIDPEGFVDFQTNRPHVSLDDALIRKIEWPENAFYHARITGSDRDAVLLLGVEPSLRWKTFLEARPTCSASSTSSSSSRSGRCSPTSRTRAAPVTGAASDPQLVESLGLQHSRYEGPTGIVGVLQDACRNAELPAASLWAAVPHYVSLAPSPRAARALCDRLAQLLGPDRHRRARGGGRGLRGAGHGGGLHRRGRRRTWPSWSAAPTSSTSKSRSTFPPATRSPPS